MDEGTTERFQVETERFREAMSRVREAVGRTIVGQDRVVTCTLTALVAGGNLLLEGVPGLGKTELVKALSHVLNLEFKRVQFTPDLMPGDIIGTNVMSLDATGQYRFEFRRGPVFTQLLLADEINRATPKTQSALLETMQELSVTVDGTSHPLKPPFFVLATQNPIEQEGTYPLPEAQLDRFLFKVDVPFPGREDLRRIMERTVSDQPVEDRPVLDGAGILELRRTLDTVVIAEPLRDYAVRLVLASHPDSEFAPERVRRLVRWGASPRAGQGLLRAARVRALLNGRANVAFEDVRHFAPEVLRHRILLNYDGQAEGVRADELVTDILEATPELAERGSARG
jgi:MoxR-like ATPase